MKLIITFNMKLLLFQIIPHSLGRDLCRREGEKAAKGVSYNASIFSCKNGVYFCPEAFPRF